MKKLCRMALMSVALVGMTLLSTTPVEGRDKPPKKAKPKAAPKPLTAPQLNASHDHIYKAIHFLHVARHNAKSAPRTYDRFGGHRNKAVEHMGHAIKELEHALKYVGAKPAPTPNESKIVVVHPPLQHALKIANDALAHAKAAAPIYDWHRARGIGHLENTHKELKEGIAFYAAHPTK
jgi:hypothetical protein